MIAEVGEELPVLHQALLEPCGILGVDDHLDLGEGPVRLAHVPSPPPSAGGGGRCKDHALDKEAAALMLSAKVHSGGDVTSLLELPDLVAQPVTELSSA